MKKNNAEIEDPILTQGLISLMVEKGLISKTILGIDDKTIKKIYTKGKNLYDSGKYEESRQLFSLLTLLENKNSSFLYGLASSAMMLEDLTLAINAFTEYAAVAPTDPTPYFYIASCYEKRKDWISTLIALQAAVNVAKEQPQYQGMKQRALLAIEFYTKTLSEEGKK